MTDCWFELISSKDGSLGSAAERALNVDGFIVFPGPVPREHLEELTQAYDNAFRSAEPPDVVIGSSTTRVSDFVNRDSIFDQLYLYGPLLEACCRIIQQPFKLSTMLARTLRPHGAAQKLHVDFASDKLGWPMVGFILMIDEFRPENGATCFVRGSQGTQIMPADPVPVPACGPAGSLIIFNGSVWHGHGSNQTNYPRRSIQGAFIRRTEKSGGNLLPRMRQETMDRISPLAKYLLELKGPAPIKNNPPRP